MQKITPFLWFDNNAEEALNFYTSLFKNSKMMDVRRYGEGQPFPGEQPFPAGTFFEGSFQLDGQLFMAINAGPHFKITPAISFFVNCESENELQSLWDKLSDGGVVMMALGEYPFSKKFGWVQDKFGLSWQLNLAKADQKITTFLMYHGKNLGKAEEAMNFYCSLFEKSGIKQIQHYGKDQGGVEGSVLHATFSLNGQDFMAVDSNFEHDFSFTEGFSLFVDCDDQAEADDFWNKFTADGGEESMCGWLKDKYGVSWQIVPKDLWKYVYGKDPAGAARAMQAMFQMQKIDVAALKKAYEG